MLRRTVLHPIPSRDYRVRWRAAVLDRHRLVSTVRLTRHADRRLGAVKQQVRANCNVRCPAWLASVHERRRLIVVARFDAVALGIALEYAQLYSGWRDFDIGDLVAGVAGVCCGLGAALVLRSPRRVLGFARSLREWS